MICSFFEAPKCLYARRPPIPKRSKTPAIPMAGFFLCFAGFPSFARGILLPALKSIPQFTQITASADKVFLHQGHFLSEGDALAVNKGANCARESAGTQSSRSAGEMQSSTVTLFLS